MSDLNEALLEGRLVRDPHSFETESGVHVCLFTIASNSQYVEKRTGQTVTRTNYMPIETWRNVADFCMKYVKKGSGVRVTGKIKTSRWMADNVMKERICIAAEHIEFSNLSRNTNTNKEKRGNTAPDYVKAEDEEPVDIPADIVEKQITEVPETDED